MKLCNLIISMALSASSVEAFTFSRVHHCKSYTTTISSPQSLQSSSPPTQLHMSDFDFPSAMPAKPEQTMKEKMQESATQFIANINAQLDEGVKPPPEMESLQQARDADADEKILAIKIYELMIEQGMTYDINPETGRLSPTEFDIKNNLEIPEVKSEFKQLYEYGMQLIQRGLIGVDDCKDIVKSRLIDRTGLSPEEFDKWLGY